MHNGEDLLPSTILSFPAQNYDLPHLYSQVKQRTHNLLAISHWLHSKAVENRASGFQTRLSLNFLISFFFFFLQNFLFSKIKKITWTTLQNDTKIKQLKDIRNYLQYDTTAIKKNTNTTVQLPINLINN